LGAPISSHSHRILVVWGQIGSGDAGRPGKDDMKAIARASGFVAGGLACLAGPDAASAAFKVLEANLAASTPPTITVKFYENINDWDAGGNTVWFHLYAYMKTNVGTYIQNYSVYTPNNEREIIGVGVPKELVRIWRNRRTGRLPSNQLGVNTQRAIQLCRQNLPNGHGSRVIGMPIQLTLNMVIRRYSRYRHRKFVRAVRGRVSCVGLPDEQHRKPSAPQRKVRLHVTGASMKVTPLTRHCPRLIGVRVILRANKDGRARYALHIRRGRVAVQRGKMVIRWRGGKRYWGTFDHRFRVRRTRLVTLWVTHKGRIISPRRRIRVNCRRTPRQPKKIKGR
jgi:hypothetical protein